MNLSSYIGTDSLNSLRSKAKSIASTAAKKSGKLYEAGKSTVNYYRGPRKSES